MSEQGQDRIWDRFLPPEDKAVYAASGHRQPMGFGQRPALLVIDVNYSFTGDVREPILDSIRRWPHSCGEVAWDALPHIRALIDVCRARGLPIIYTTGGFRADGWDLGSWRWKSKRAEEDATRVRDRRNLDGNMINHEIAPADQDIVIEKIKPSAFNGTPLRQFLTMLKVDTLVTCGTTTSGCVRASVIDAFTDNYRVIVPEECCFDRGIASHAINLFDMDAKYADVVPTARVIAHLSTVSEGLFDLPPGPR